VGDGTGDGSCSTNVMIASSSAYTFCQGARALRDEINAESRRLIQIGRCGVVSVPATAIRRTYGWTMGIHGRNWRQRTRIGIGCIAVILAVGACGGDDDDVESSDADGAAAAVDSSADTGADAGEDGDGGDESGDPSAERESPYEVDAVEPVDQGVGTVTIDGTTYELLDVGDPDDEGDGVCRKGPVADQLEVVMNNVDATGAPVPEKGAEGFFNTFFADLPYNSTFSPSVEFKVDNTRLSSSAPDLPTEVAWGFSPDGLHAEGTATLYDRDDDRAVEATFSVTCPDA